MRTQVRGRIGLVDAYLVSHLWRLSPGDGSLELGVAGALYPDLIPETDLVTTLGGLRCAGRVSTSPAAGAAAIPEEELADLSRRHVLEGRPVPCQVALDGPDLRTSMSKLLDLYGGRPGHRDRPLLAVSGCFDVFHANHYRLVSAARRLSPGGRLLAITLSDEGIARLEKNARGDRPVYPEECRTRVLSALRDVAHVLVMDDIDCREALNALGVDLYVKTARDRERAIIAAEAETVVARGGRAVFLEQSGTAPSTTALLAALRRACLSPEREGGQR